VFEKSYERNNIFLNTFKSCPNIFQHLYCIHASIKRGSEEIYVPFVYCLLVGKSQFIYSEMKFIHFLCIRHVFFISAKIFIEQYKMLIYQLSV